MERKSLVMPQVPWLLLLSSFVAVEASPQFSTTLVNKIWEFLPKDTTATVENCMGETNSGLVNWQNPAYPSNESLPGICTLTLNPAEGTCAYRLNFADLDLTDKSGGLLASLLTSIACPTDSPYIKVSSVNYTAPARCQNLTGYEAIVQLPEESTEPVVLLLQTDPKFNTSFKVNIESVACDDIKSFKSPNICGIKNQQFNEEGRKNILRSYVLTKDSMLLEKEPKGETKLNEGVEVRDEISLDPSMENPGAFQEEMIESIEEARRSRRLSDEYSMEPYTDSPVFRRLTDEQLNKKNKRKNKDKVKAEKKPLRVVELTDEAKEFAETLKKKGNILSYGLGAGIEKGSFKYQPNADTRVPGVPSNPNEWPWMAVVSYTANITVPFFGELEIQTACNGALLDDSHVITQASCLPGASIMKGSLDSVRVHLGGHSIDDLTEITNVSVSKITFPMTFSSIGVSDDIAIVTLSEALNYTEEVRPVCLPVSYNNFPEDNGVLTGWQFASINDPSTIVSGPSINLFPNFGSLELNQLDVKVLNKSICNETMSLLGQQLSLLTGAASTIDPDEYVCLVDQDTEFPVCNVGLGTPLVQEDLTNAYYLTGISSIFSSCSTNAASVFTAIKPDDSFLNLALV